MTLTSDRSEMRTFIRDRLAEAPRPALGGEDSDGIPHSEFDLNPHLRRAVLDGKPPRPAAVLVPLVDRSDGMTVLLTQRTEHLRDHAGQVSFPGGRVEEHDESHVHTALREAEEEVGLEGRHVEVTGTLEPYLTGTGFLVTPVVGFVTPGFSLKIDTFEVAEAFEVPLEFLMNPDNHERREMEVGQGKRHYYAMPYEDYFIWGATAAMLMNLYHRLYR